MTSSLDADDTDGALQLLGEGELDVQGRLVDASNATLYCAVRLDGVEAVCVYKPIAGERPLWDFPDGTLAFREVAAYAVSAATGWDVVPPTVLRDGPYGEGMCQLWIDVDETVDLGELARSDHPDLRRMSVLDSVINNADRKGGHLLPTPDGHVYGVDHGVCFSVEDKLRTLAVAVAGQAARRRVRRGAQCPSCRPRRPARCRAAPAAGRRRGAQDGAARRPPAAYGPAPAAVAGLARDPLAAVLTPRP